MRYGIMDLAHPTLGWAKKGMAKHGHGMDDDPYPLVTGCQDLGCGDLRSGHSLVLDRDLLLLDDVELVHHQRRQFLPVLVQVVQHI